MHLVVILALPILGGLVTTMHAIPRGRAPSTSARRFVVEPRVLGIALGNRVVRGGKVHVVVVERLL